jgi:2-C-methyl-D-erythritol 4-phosphate cytidylyltransferase/2-C-methyl-D-erythritol 2,4-cyclodiphosphate synthase
MHGRRLRRASRRIGEIVVVRNADDAEVYAACGIEATRPLRVVTGGADRGASVRAGLDAVSGAHPFVLIHDAARPLVSTRVIDGVLAALDTHPGAAPALAVTDALWRGRRHGHGTQSREGLWRAQTPQGFHLDAIRAAHAAHEGAAADDVEVARKAGLSVAITEGDETNIKITTAAISPGPRGLWRTDGYPHRQWLRRAPLRPGGSRDALRRRGAP